MLCRAISLTIIIVLCAFWARDGSIKRGRFVHFDLRCSCEGWGVGFSDYWAAQESDYGLTWSCHHEETNSNRGLVVSGSNHSDDLFMFIKHPLHGLRPDTIYSVSGCVEFLSKAPTGCVGIGGDPGGSVCVKFGAMTEEPFPILQDDGRVKMNVDIGNQSVSGSDAVVIGNIATTITDCHNERFESKELSTPAPITVRSDSAGILWLLIGTDSGFEGKTSVIYTDVRVYLHPHRLHGKSAAR